MSTYEGAMRHLERAWIVFVHRAFIRPLHINEFIRWLTAVLRTGR